ncbi:glycoside hydrolase family 36 protein [Sphingomonas sp.]|uniref:glycoside hydrolase family 36 protein n=1 Tax=Sphingomonas sp. TaxID=28214 RepID=UPI001DAD8D57|nr:glycoside hydrolase family 36 protein [Sphingomonas sp.]MBX9796989.1 alpha-galactosidase [Sphingomonas sp.]
MTTIALGGLTLSLDTILVDGMPGDATLSHIETDGMHRLSVTAPGAGPLSSVGLRFVVAGASRYLRNGYHSWDGSWWAAPGTRDADEPEGKQPSLGFAMTALQTDAATVVLGAERHDRFQTRLRFGGTAARMTIDIETLLDATGARSGETLLLFADAKADDALRRWSSAVAAASPLPPRLPTRRITGWCSWYNLYAAITEENIRDHFQAARRFRDEQAVLFDIFLIDDGFTPEMGDWLDVKPQFPRGMKPLLGEIEAAGFTPGLWIAPFLVGNRSKLYRANPDWAVQDRKTGGPLLAMHFYGEFRWHKRSEEYYILDITHPAAATYLANVLHTWRHDWGARYFKADFMYHGMEHGPDRAQWHQPGLSRVEVWRRMVRIMRRAIGEDAMLAGCGAPLWASVGLFDAVRISRDVGVTMTGADQSAESLLRDSGTRWHAHDVLWQADPDCILLRDRFHHLSDAHVETLARHAAGVGGALMTSDHLGELSPARQALLASLLRDAERPAPRWLPRFDVGSAPSEGADE